MNFMNFIHRLAIVSGGMCFCLSSCEQEDIPLYRPEPEVKTRTISFYFQDKSDETPNVAIYINNSVLRGSNGTRGLLEYAIPDSLQNRTFTIALGEYQSSEAPSELDVDGIVFETLLFPSELSTVSSVLLTRENELAPVEVIKIGIAEDEPAPAPGYFKVKFYNVTGDTIGIETRDGKPILGYEALKGFEDRAFIELPFGSYRFTARRRKDSTTLGLAAQPPLLQGSAGRAYTVLLSNEAQQITEVKDFGTPAQTLAHLGFVNVMPGQATVTLQPFQGAARTLPEEKFYTQFTGVEMIPSGTVTVKVTDIGGKEIEKRLEVAPWEQVVAYLVEKDGQPDIQFVHCPLTENNFGYDVYTRYLNFSPDAGEISFARVVPTTDPIFTETPVTVISPRYTSNLSFGEVPVTTNTTSTNTVYATFDINNAPVLIQAHRAIKSEMGLGEAIANTRTAFPFFFSKPTAEPDQYNGRAAQAGTYSVIIAGRIAADAPEDQKARIIVIPHSY